MARLHSAARSAPGNPCGTGPKRPERPCPPAPVRSVPDAPPSLSSPWVRFYRNDPALTKYVQIRQHLLDRAHGGLQFLGITGADHEIGIRLLVLVLERVAADDGGRMRIGDFVKRTADVPFARVGANRVRQHPDAGLQLRRH